MPPYTAMEMSRQGAWEVNKISCKLGQTVASISGSLGRRKTTKDPDVEKKEPRKTSLLFQSIKNLFFFRLGYFYTLKKKKKKKNDQLKQDVVHTWVAELRVS